MNDKEKKDYEGEEWCPGCRNMFDWHNGKGRRFFFLRWILGIFILIIVFWLGVKVGQFSGFYRGNYGYPMMGGGYYRSMMYPGYDYDYNQYPGYYGPGMMQGWNYYNQQQQTPNQ